MNVDDFIWLSDIVDKLAVKHHVSQDEAEEVFFNQPKYGSPKTASEKERMFTLYLGKPMQAVIWSFSSFAKQATGH